MTTLEALLRETLQEASDLEWSTAASRRAWRTGRRRRLRTVSATASLGLIGTALLGGGVVEMHSSSAPILQSAPPVPTGKPTNVLVGSSIGEVHIPRLGEAYHPVLVEGIGILKHGPGHFPATAEPGQVGNFAVYGQRTTFARPFQHLDELRPGDAIVIETAKNWFTYVVTGSVIVKPSDLAVITTTPPGIGDQRKSRRLLTFVTETPLGTAAQRLVVRGILTATDRKRHGFTPAPLR